MPSTSTREVTVDELSKYGFKSNNVYINWSKTIKDSEKGKMVPGGTYLCELWKADSGKEYVNKVLGTSESGVGPTVKSVAKKAEAPATKTVAQKSTPKVENNSTNMSKDEWAAKDRRISRQGLIQASILALAPTLSTELLFDEAIKLADKALEYVNKKD